MIVTTLPNPTFHGWVGSGEDGKKVCRIEGCTDQNEICYEHNQHESEEGAYRICGECYHVFKTEEELLEAYNSDLSDDIPTMTEVERIYFCPYCIHDF